MDTDTTSSEENFAGDQAGSETAPGTKNGVPWNLI
jgi:hypothetical protein